MFGNQPQYHSVFKKIITIFGALFSDIHIIRYNKDNDPIQTLKIPIAYAPKEKWLVRLDQDPNLTKHTYASFPRLSFEITDYNYNNEKQLNKFNAIKCINDGIVSFAVAPVPYEINIALYVISKTNEDVLQIVEQILPLFNPTLTVSAIVLKELNIANDIPITLTGTSIQDDFEGDFQTRRIVIHTLTFNIKTNIYGRVSTSEVIETAMASLTSNEQMNQLFAKFTAVGDPVTGEIIEGWDE